MRIEERKGERADLGMNREKRDDDQEGKRVSSVRIHDRERDARLICVVRDTKI